MWKKKSFGPNLHSTASSYRQQCISSNNQYIYKYKYNIIWENVEYQCHENLEGMFFQVFSSAGSSEPVPSFIYHHKLPWGTAPQHFISHSPSSSCSSPQGHELGAKLSASSSYKEKPPLSANLAFSDCSLQCLKSPGLPQERQRTHGWGHGRGEGGSFDLDCGSKTMIQTECSSTGS